MNAETPPETPAPADKKPNNLLVDMGPVIAYVIAFNLARRFTDADTALYIGAIVIAVAIVAAVIYSKRVYGKVSILLKVSAVLIVGSVAVTLGFRNPIVFKMKPTALNLLYGGMILGSLAMGKNIFKLLMGEVYTLPDKAWRTLAFRWGIFFLFLAVLNEFIWRTQTTEFWSNFKFFGMFPITMVFAMLNVPLLMKHMPQTEDNS
jgi:intracellular septation protein